MLFLQSIPQLQLLISIAGIIGAGIAAYVGVRVAITEVRGQLNTHDEKFRDGDRRQAQCEQRIDRLEGDYFSRRR